MQIDIEKAKRNLVREARGFVLVFVYLYVCIVAISVYRSLTLRAFGIDYFPFGFAFIEALILAKFIVTGHMLRIGSGLDHKPLIYPTLYKAFIFFLLLLALSVVEEAIKGLRHGKTFIEAVLELGHGTLPGLLAYSIIGFLFLLPYIALRQVNEVLGEGRLFDLFFKSGASLRASTPKSDT
jgi:hypothetical protein